MQTAYNQLIIEQTYIKHLSWAYTNIPNEAVKMTNIRLSSLPHHIIIEQSNPLRAFFEYWEQ